MMGVSFIVPCFNASEFVEQCCLMLLQQTDTRFEIVFVDDGSSDNTLEKLKGLEANNITVVSQENRGIAGARLTGLNNAKFDYVAFVDVDDFLDDTLTGEVITIFNEYPETQAVLYNFGYYTLGEFKSFPHDFSVPCTGLDIVRKTIPSWRAYTNGVMRKDHAIYGYSESLPDTTNSDEMANRIAILKCKEVRKAKSKYYYVVRKDSTSTRVSDKLLTRLDTAFWARRVLPGYFSDSYISRDLYIFVLTEYCSLFLLFYRERKKISSESKLVWIKSLKSAGSDLLSSTNLSYLRSAGVKKVFFLLLTCIFFVFHRIFGRKK